MFYWLNQMEPNMLAKQQQAAIASLFTLRIRRVLKQLTVVLALQQ